MAAARKGRKERTNRLRREGWRPGKGIIYWIGEERKGQRERQEERGEESGQRDGK